MDCYSSSNPSHHHNNIAFSLNDSDNKETDDNDKKQILSIWKEEIWQSF